MSVTTSANEYVQLASRVNLIETFNPNARESKIESGSLEYSNSKIIFKSKNREIFLITLQSLSIVRKRFKIKTFLIRSAIYFPLFVGLMLLNSLRNMPDSWEDWRFLLSLTLALAVFVSCMQELLNYIYGKWIEVSYINFNKNQSNVYLNVSPSYTDSTEKLHKKLKRIYSGEIQYHKLK